VSAPWCPTCAAQKPIIQQLAASPEFEGVTIYHVDFDSQKDVVRSLGAFTQSTLIAFKGNVETGRSIGDTDSESIKLLFQSSIRE
jgi:thiol-disulfide isomerase/thioredoxin